MLLVERRGKVYIMSVNKKICPLCGKENNCGYEKGLEHGICWCTTIKVPKELLAQVPEEVKGKACVCRDCIIAFKEKHSSR